MNLKEENIHNLTSMWRIVAQSQQSFFYNQEFQYCLVENSDWPNRLWFKGETNETTLNHAIEVLSGISDKIILPVWEIYQNNMSALYESKGFHKVSEQIGMVLKLNKNFEEDNIVEITPVFTFSDALLWTELFSKAFGYRINPESVIATCKEINYFIAYHNKQAIGTGILHATENIAGIHGIGTIPEMRRKGLAEQIMKVILNLAIAQNSEYATLQASDMGKNIYLKLGFEEQFKMRNYIL